MPANLNKLLIANRGEIAIRIHRTASAMGLSTVSVFPEDDKQSLHVDVADRSVQLEGVGAAAYLDIEQIIDVAQEHRCDAIHPGYGFLAENADLADACAKSGITFIGPRPTVLKLMGDKLEARNLAAMNQIPVLPATGILSSSDEAAEFMRSVALDGQVMLKAVAGGGGRGMRVVDDLKKLDSAIERGSAEALVAFGSGDLYAELRVDRALHIEVQIVGDNHGEISHLGERDCSIQRRNQKVVEVAPSPQLPNPLRQRILADAVKLAQAANYNNVGTFEFLVDGEELNDDSAYFFMEANPRLQVEHTVTEQVTSVDLVRTQIEIAQGRTLDDLHIKRDEVPQPRGYAIQLRVNMETLQPDGVALPAAETLTAFVPPIGPGVRVDTFGYEGYKTSGLYDSLLAKLIVHSGQPSFEDAANRAMRALQDFVITGVETNLGVLMNTMDDANIREGRMYTRFVDDNLTTLLTPRLLAAKPSTVDRIRWCTS